nr:hypothetical protein [Mesorhizobium sp. CO1-1-8]
MVRWNRAHHADHGQDRKRQLDLDHRDDCRHARIKKGQRLGCQSRSGQRIVENAIGLEEDYPRHCPHEERGPEREENEEQEDRRGSPAGIGDDIRNRVSDDDREARDDKADQDRPQIDRPEIIARFLRQAAIGFDLHGKAGRPAQIESAVVTVMLLDDAPDAPLSPRRVCPDQLGFPGLRIGAIEISGKRPLSA